MIHKLKFSVTFPTGRTISGDHSFSDGVSLIQGPNEAGKSLRIEMIRFALFGSAALRGIGSDYKNLSVELEFTVKEVKYTIVRTSTKATIQHGDDVLATSTKAVNQFVVNLFGYDLTVFDMANAVLQGQVETLGDMKPTERRLMVEQVVGLNQVDGLIDYVQKILTMTRAEIIGLQRALKDAPTPPTPPPGYGLNAIENARARLAAYSSSLDQFYTAKARLSQPIPQLGPQPTCGINDTVDALESYQQERQQRVARKAYLAGLLTACPPTTVSEISLQAWDHELRVWDQWVAWSDHNTRFPPPNRSKEDLLELQQAWDLHHKQHTRQQMEALLAKLDSEKVHCPKCAHDFSLNTEVYDSLVNQIAEYPPGDPVAPDVPLQKVRDELRYLESYIPNPFRPVEKPSKPTKTAAQLEALWESYHRSAEIAAIQKEYDEIAIGEDREADLKALRYYHTALGEWETRRFLHEEHMKEREAAKEVYEMFKYVPQQVEGIRKLISDYDYHEMALKSYQNEIVRFEKSQRALEEATKKEADYIKALKGLKTFKSNVKAYLVPSLNSVASMLIAQMTNGQRTKIEVSQDFDISVDGQRLETLSGSGKAVANLAIRIGLGQVLTNQVFSVLMADEIDASMDTQRGEYTIDCLRNLSSNIRQIFFVSHKQILADHMIEV